METRTSLVFASARARSAMAVCLVSLSVVLAPAALAQVGFSEVLFDPVGEDAGKQWIELRNPRSELVDIGGYWIVFPPTAYRIPAGTELAGGRSVLIRLNRSGTSTATEIFTGIAGIRNLRANDGLALFNSLRFDDPAAIVDFVQWGAPGTPFEDLAVAAGIWEAGDVIDTSPLRPGSSIAYDGIGNRAADWCLDGTPSPGAGNSSCDPSRVASAVRINEIGSTLSGEIFIELIHAGDPSSGILEDLGGYWLVSGDDAFEIPRRTFMGPGDIVLVHAGPDAPAGALHLRPGDSFTGPDLRGPGSVALFGDGALDDSTWLIDFVQWGEPAQLFEAVAAEAGLWDVGTAAALDDLRSGGSLASRGAPVGVDRWLVDNTPTPGLSNFDAPQTDLVINEILLAPIGAGRQAVELYNRGSDTVAVGEYSICLEPRSLGSTVRCYDIPDGLELEAGGYLVIWINANGSQIDNNLFTGPFPTLRREGDAVALIFTGSAENPWNFMDFVRWSDGGNTLGAVATEAGIWPEGGVFELGALVDGTSIVYLGRGRGPDQYALDLSPTPGLPNNPIGMDPIFSRGDCTGDGAQDITDPVLVLEVEFLGGAAFICQDACDFNDDNKIDVTDAISSLGHQFLGDPGPARPLDCGPDPTEDSLTCESFPICE